MAEYTVEWLDRTTAQNTLDILGGVLPDLWAGERGVNPLLLLWPARPITDDHGNTVGGLIAQDLKGDSDTWGAQMQRSIQRIQPFAVCFVRPTRTGVEAHYESPIKVLRWTWSANERNEKVLMGPAHQDLSLDHSMFFKPSGALLH